MTAAGSGRATAASVIAKLGLAPHPEGGYFRETFRDTAMFGDDRAAATAIYFLLDAGQRSHWHRIDACEIWHWYGGDPLELSIAPDNGDPAGLRTVRLGPDVLAGEEPQAVVPAGHWQSARSLCAWTLAGCTVAPGFTFDRFELAPPGFDPSQPR